MSSKGIGDYCLEGPVAALRIIERLTGERAVDVFGFCMGGALAAITAAYLSATGQANRVGSLSMIGTLLDFKDTGAWATFFEPGQMDALDRHAQKTGLVGADKLQALFSTVRANDLIWASVVNHYLLDREAPVSDLLFWFADGSRLPQALLVEYGKELLPRPASTCARIPAEGCRLRFQLLVYPNTTILGSGGSRAVYAEGYYLTLAAAHHLFQFYVDEKTASDPRIDLLHRDDLAGLPPTLLTVGHCDILFDECLAFARKLQSANAPLQVLTYPGFIHGFLGFSEQVPAVSNAFQVIGRALAIGLESAGSRDERQA